MDRRATAVWQGDLRHGKGTLTTESKALSATPYSFSTRFEGAPGTNPEELLGAAHAGCFTMALTHSLGEAGITPERIETRATVTLEKTEAGFTITKVHLDVGIQAPGADRCEGRRVRAEGEGQLPAQPRAEGRHLDGGAAQRLKMLTPFHLAIPVRELKSARAFYGGLLGCPEGRSSAEWVDFDFFGHQLVCHLVAERGRPRAPRTIPWTAMTCPCRISAWCSRCRTGMRSPQGCGKRAPPSSSSRMCALPGQPGEQATMFLYDPSGNALEFKAFRDIAGQLFAK